MVNHFPYIDVCREHENRCQHSLRLGRGPLSGPGSTGPTSAAREPCRRGGWLGRKRRMERRLPASFRIERGRACGFRQALVDRLGWEELDGRDDAPPRCRKALAFASTAFGRQVSAMTGAGWMEVAREKTHCRGTPRRDLDPFQRRVEMFYRAPKVKERTAS